MKRAKKEFQKSMNKKAKRNIHAKPKKPMVNKNEDVHKLVLLLKINQVELEHQNQEL